MNEKVYCKTCKYIYKGLIDHDLKYGYFCLNSETMEDTPIQQIHMSCWELNKDNDCKYFRIKKWNEI